MAPTTRPLRPIVAVLVAAAVLACAGKGPATTQPSAATAPSAAPTRIPASTAANPPVAATTDALLVTGRAGDDGLQVIVASTAERVLDLPTGTPDASWSRLVTTSAKGARTVVEELVVDSSEHASQTIDGAWRLPTIGADPTPVGVSIDGKTIVLVEDRAATAASAKATSRFAILDGSLKTAPRIVTLHGSFEYDTLSPDGRTLYVVEHLAAPPDGHYQVRAVDTATGALRDGVVVDKTEGDEAMAGYPIAQLRRPDGMVFTLYRGPEHPFIHALSSVEGWALCIDLPATGADDAAAALDWGLAVTAGGDSLVAANATIGVAVEIPLGDLTVSQSVTFSPSASTAISLAKFGHEPGGPVGRRLVASPVGSALYAAGAGGIVSLSATDLTVIGRFLEGVSVDSMAVTPDGSAVYALVHGEGRIVKLDAATGKMVGQVPGTGFDRLVAIVPW
jgi:DNA-binding beta-propeller fold protein YncE